MVQSLNLKPLLLAGGKSSRMGSPKHLLPFIDGEPIYMRLMSVLQYVCPGSDTLYMSVAQEADAERIIEAKLAVLNKKIVFIHDREARTMFPDRKQNGNGLPEDEETGEQESIGPAAGLLAAHNLESNATWLITACDYPLITSDAMMKLLRAYQEPLTCFKNAEGFEESLLAIWSPRALKVLQKNVTEGKTGPIAAVKQIGARTLRLPADEEMALMNTNTREQWEEALVLASQSNKASYHGIGACDFEQSESPQRPYG